MSEATEQEVDKNIDLEAIANSEEEIALEENQEEVKFTELEQTAYDQGWRPEDDFKGKEGNWKTPKEYITHGEYIGNINSLHQKIEEQSRKFDERLDNSNKLHEVRRQSEIKELKSKQREAVDVSDTTAYDKAQDQIDELEKQDVGDSTTNKDSGEPKHASIAAWESKNTWINDPSDERAPVATGLWNSYLQLNPDATVDQALKHVDTRMSSLYPSENTNPRRNQPNTTETSNKPARNKGKELTMNDLTPSEINEWDMFGQSMFKTEKVFLKAIR